VLLVIEQARKELLVEQVPLTAKLEGKDTPIKLLAYTLLPKVMLIVRVVLAPIE